MSGVECSFSKVICGSPGLYVDWMQWVREAERQCSNQLPGMLLML